MINRYSTKRMQKIWTLENKFNTYLKVELAATKAWCKEGLISNNEFVAIKSNSKIDLKAIEKIEEITKHDVIAFTRSISNQLGVEKKWFHYGLTSTDVVDTAYAVQLKEANIIILEELISFSGVLKEKALKYKNTPVMGRTHGVHAEITSLGLKFALWYDEMQRNIKRFKSASSEIETGKISGAVGNFVNTPTHIQDLICNELNINSSNISTQTLQRDIYAEYVSVISIIGTTLEKIAIEIRNSQRTEVREMMEYFDKGQKGSSAMPHKRNPIGSENITGISRLLRGYVIPSLENNALWYERDISHSSVERVVIPDVTNLIDYALQRMNKIIKNIIVDEEQMLKNINITKGTIFSQRVLNSMIEKGISRDEAYDLIQPISIKAWDEQINFIDLLKENKVMNSLFKKEELESLFSVQFYLQKTNEIFDRVFK